MFKNVMINRLVWMVTSLLCMPSVVFAEEAQSIEEFQLDNIVSNGTLYYGGMGRAVLSLLIVIGLIYLTAWVYKRLNNFNSQNLTKVSKNLDTNKFKLLSTQALGANKNLHVVEINGKYLVIGSTANNISLIKEFDKNIIDNCTKETAVNRDKPESEQPLHGDDLSFILDKYKEIETEDENAQDK